MHLLDLLSARSRGMYLTLSFGCSYCRCRTKTDSEFMEMVEHGAFRKDFFSFGWGKEDGASASNTLISRCQMMLPQALRWVGEGILRLVLDRKSFLKLDTEHLKQVDWSIQENLVSNVVFVGCYRECWSIHFPGMYVSQSLFLISRYKVWSAGSI